MIKNSSKNHRFLETYQMIVFYMVDIVFNPLGSLGEKNEGFSLLPFNFFSENEHFLSLLLSVKKTNSRQHNSSVLL